MQDNIKAELDSKEINPRKTQMMNFQCTHINTKLATIIFC